MPTLVTAVPPASSAEAREHFANEFRFETDCWDVHDALSKGADFVLLDVRGPAMFAKGHVPGAINLPHGKIVTSKVAQWPEETIFVTYCAGPHCNGAARGALRLAELGRPAKREPTVWNGKHRPGTNAQSASIAAGMPKACRRCVSVLIYSTFRPTRSAPMRWNRSGWDQRWR